MAERTRKRKTIPEEEEQLPLETDVPIQALVCVEDVRSQKGSPFTIRPLRRIQWSTLVWQIREAIARQLSRILRVHIPPEWVVRLKLRTGQAMWAAFSADNQRLDTEIVAINPAPYVDEEDQKLSLDQQLMTICYELLPLQPLEKVQRELARKITELAATQSDYLRSSVVKALMPAALLGDEAHANAQLAVTQQNYVAALRTALLNERREVKRLRERATTTQKQAEFTENLIAIETFIDFLYNHPFFGPLYRLAAERNMDGSQLTLEGFRKRKVKDVRTWMRDVWGEGADAPFLFSQPKEVEAFLQTLQLTDEDLKLFAEEVMTEGHTLGTELEAHWMRPFHLNELDMNAIRALVQKAFASAQLPVQGEKGMTPQQKLFSIATQTLAVTVVNYGRQKISGVSRKVSEEEASRRYEAEQRLEQEEAQAQRAVVVATRALQSQLINWFRTLEAIKNKALVDSLLQEAVFGQDRRQNFRFFLSVRLQQLQNQLKTVLQVLQGRRKLVVQDPAWREWSAAVYDSLRRQSPAASAVTLNAQVRKILTIAVREIRKAGARAYMELEAPEAVAPEEQLAFAYESLKHAQTLLALLDRLAQPGGIPDYLANLYAPQIAELNQLATVHPDVAGFLQQEITRLLQGIDTIREQIEEESPAAAGLGTRKRQLLLESGRLESLLRLLTAEGTLRNDLQTLTLWLGTTDRAALEEYDESPDMQAQFVSDLQFARQQQHPAEKAAELEQRQQQVQRELDQVEEEVAQHLAAMGFTEGEGKGEEEEAVEEEEAASYALQDDVELALGAMATLLKTPEQEEEEEEEEAETLRVRVKPETDSEQREHVRPLLRAWQKQTQPTPAAPTAPVLVLTPAQLAYSTTAAEGRSQPAPMRTK